MRVGLCLLNVSIAERPVTHRACAILHKAVSEDMGRFVAQSIDASCTSICGRFRQQGKAPGVSFNMYENHVPKVR